MTQPLLKPAETRILSAFERLCAYGEAPSLDEVAHAAGFGSRGSIYRHIQRLIQMGYLQRGGTGSPRSIQLARLANPAERLRLPHLGRIVAGRPIEAVAEQQSIHVGELLCSGERYALTVEGDSMIEAGIAEGDLVIIDRARTPRDGDIVVALVDGTDNTLKRLHTENDGTVLLVPANARLSALRLDPARVQLQGVLVAQIRMHP